MISCCETVRLLPPDHHERRDMELAFCQHAMASFTVNLPSSNARQLLRRARQYHAGPPHHQCRHTAGGLKRHLRVSGAHIFI